MVTCKVRLELFGGIIICLRPLLVYHQSIMVPVKVDIDALFEVSLLNAFINTHFSVAIENLIHCVMILKVKGNDDTR